MMFSCVFDGSSQCRLVLIVSSFVSLLMVSGLSSVRDVKSVQEKGRMQYASDQKIACLRQGCFRKKEGDDSYSDFSIYLDPPKPFTPESTPTMENMKKGIQTNATDCAVE